MEEDLPSFAKYFDAGDIDRCKTILEKLRDSNQKAVTTEKFAIDNNILVCEGILQMKRGDAMDSHAQMFEKLLNNIKAAASKEESMLALEVAVVCNLIVCFIDQFNEIDKKLLKCQSLWRDCLSRINSFIRWKTKFEMPSAKLCEETFTYLNKCTQQTLHYCACIITLVFLLSGKKCKGKELLDVVTKVRPEIVETKDLLLLSLLGVPSCGSTFSGSTCFHHDLVEICCSTWAFVTRDWEGCVSHLAKVKMHELQPLTTYNAAFAEYKSGRNYSVVTRTLEHLLSDRDVVQTPLAARVHNLIGCVLADQGKPNMAVQHFLKAYNTDDRLLRSLYNIALQYRAQKLYDAEIEALQLWVKHFQEPKPKCHQLSVGLYPLLKLMDSADGGTYVQACFMLARRCLELNRYSLAAEHYLNLLAAILSEPIAINPHWTSFLLPPPLQQVYHEAAFSLLRCGRFQDALAVCQEAIAAYSERHPQEPRRFSQISNPVVSTEREPPLKRRKVGNEEVVFSVLEEDLSVPSASVPFHLVQDVDAATEAGTLPDDVVARTILACACMKSGNFNEALDSIYRVLSSLRQVSFSDEENSSGTGRLYPWKTTLRQLEAYIYNLRGIAQIANGNQDDALNSLRLSLQLDQDCGIAWYNYTLLMLMLGRREEGLQNWRHFRERVRKSDGTSSSNQSLEFDDCEVDFQHLDDLARRKKTVTA